MQLPIKLIIGLGNPGRQYALTRHNAGFWFVDAIAAKYNVKLKLENKFFGHVGKFSYHNHVVLVFKPETFMNLSGKAVLALKTFYKIDLAQILVIHDELDLAVGSAKLKFGGGHGGHNGLKSIDSTVGQNYWRLRLGIEHPGDKSQVAAYVLNKPDLATQIGLEEAITRSINILELLLNGEFNQALKVLHTNQC